MLKIKPQRPWSTIGFAGAYRDKSYKHEFKRQELHDDKLDLLFLM